MRVSRFCGVVLRHRVGEQDRWYRIVFCVQRPGFRWGQREGGVDGGSLALCCAWGSVWTSRTLCLYLSSLDQRIVIGPADHSTIPRWAVTLCKSTSYVQADLAMLSVFASTWHQTPGILHTPVCKQAWRWVDIDVATVTVKGSWGIMEVNLQPRYAAFC